MHPTESDRRALSLAPLPREVLSLLAAHDARPRLVAHLTLVHDVAQQLVISVSQASPRLRFDADAVRFGAATHDIGKALHPEELSAPGNAHEAAGESLLVRAGIAPSRARFARTHGTPRDALDGLEVEDLLVILADTVWKGGRVRSVDDALIAAMMRADGCSAWATFMVVDTIVDTLGGSASERIAWQARFSALP
jgi:HD domain